MNGYGYKLFTFLIDNFHTFQYANEREVKAQVKLQFHDVSNKLTIVQRSMIATQKVCIITTKK
jgi:hypothetical protein